MLRFLFHGGSQRMRELFLHGKGQRMFHFFARKGEPERWVMSFQSEFFGQVFPRHSDELPFYWDKEQLQVMHRKIH